MIETDRWPKIHAKWFTPVATRRVVNRIIIHVMQAPEKLTTAEAVGNYFRTLPPERKASTHIGVDADTIVQYVADNNVAYGAAGANHDAIHIELAGYISQTREQWLDDFSRKTLDLGANAAAQYALKYEVPVCHCTDTQLKNGERGFYGHDQVSRVFKKSDHTDPGPNFPWDHFMELVSRHYAVRREQFGL